MQMEKVCSWNEGNVLSVILVKAVEQTESPRTNFAVSQKPNSFGLGHYERVMSRLCF